MKEEEEGEGKEERREDGGRICFRGKKGNWWICVNLIKKDGGKIKSDVNIRWRKERINKNHTEKRKEEEKEKKEKKKTERKE